MAKQISIDAAEAFMNRKSFNRSNTEVKNNFDSERTQRTQLFLFGNLIATHMEDGSLRVGNQGYETTTTKERLNALPGVSIHQKDFQWYLNDFQWDGKWIDPAKILLRVLDIKDAA